VKERGNEGGVGVGMGITEAEFSASCTINIVPLESARCSFIKCIPFRQFLKLDDAASVGVEGEGTGQSKM